MVNHEHMPLAVPTYDVSEARTPKRNAPHSRAEEADMLVFLAHTLREFLEPGP